MPASSPMSAVPARRLMRLTASWPSSLCRRGSFERCAVRPCGGSSSRTSSSTRSNSAPGSRSSCSRTRQPGRRVSGSSPSPSAPAAFVAPVRPTWATAIVVTEFVRLSGPAARSGRRPAMAPRHHPRWSPRRRWRRPLTITRPTQGFCQPLTHAQGSRPQRAVGTVGWAACRSLVAAVSCRAPTTVFGQARLRACGGHPRRRPSQRERFASTMRRIAHRRSAGARGPSWLASDGRERGRHPSRRRSCAPMVTSGAMDVLFVLPGARVLQTRRQRRRCPQCRTRDRAIVAGHDLLARRTAGPLPFWRRPRSCGRFPGGRQGSRADLARLRSSRWAAWATRPATSGRTILQRVTPDRMLARVLGALEGINLAGLALGSIVVTVVVGFVGVQVAMIAVGLLLPVGVGISWLGLRTMDRTTLVPTRALHLLRAVPLFEPLAPPQLERRRRTRETSNPGSPHPRGRRRRGLLRRRVGPTLRHLDGRPLGSRRSGDGLGEIALIRDVPHGNGHRGLRRAADPGARRLPEAVTGHPQAHDAARRVVASGAPDLSASPRATRQPRPEPMSAGPVPQRPPIPTGPTAVHDAAVRGQPIPRSRSTFRRRPNGPRIR